LSGELREGEPMATVSKGTARAAWGASDESDDPNADPHGFVDTLKKIVAPSASKSGVTYK
jgi:hypothetical protein